MDKRPIGYQPGKGTVLDKKVPKTNKYDHVESKLAGKTGVTIKDVEFVSIFLFMQATRKYLRRRENFLRESSQALYGK